MPPKKPELKLVIGMINLLVKLGLSIDTLIVLAIDTTGTYRIINKNKKV